MLVVGVTMLFLPGVLSPAGRGSFEAWGFFLGMLGPLLVDALDRAGRSASTAGFFIGLGGS